MIKAVNAVEVVSGEKAEPAPSDDDNGGFAWVVVRVSHGFGGQKALSLAVITVTSSQRAVVLPAAASDTVMQVFVDAKAWELLP